MPYKHKLLTYIPPISGGKRGVDHISLDVYGLTDTKSGSLNKKQLGFEMKQSKYRQYKENERHEESQKARKKRIHQALKNLRETQAKYYETKTIKQAKIQKTFQQDGLEDTQVKPRRQSNARRDKKVGEQ